MLLEGEKSISCFQEGRIVANLWFAFKGPDKHLIETDGTAGIDYIEFSSNMKLREHFAASNDGFLHNCLGNPICVPSSLIPVQVGLCFFVH